jgi:aspartate-semialdehyde dehydrogenase
VTAKLRVGILGATGVVGQRFVQMLEGHPNFEVTALAASDRSQGKSYRAATTWRLLGEMPAAVRDLVVVAPEPPLDCDVVFSSLPNEFARSVEGAFAAAGYPVISNSSAYRMDADVPLVVPEINADHLGLLDGRKNGGYVVTNPNCSAIMITMALAPLHARFGVTAAAVTTMQALSGAGYPGVPSLDIVDNVIPYIASEEEKIQVETGKILGRLNGGHIEAAAFPVSAQCHRVHVQDGHLGAIRVKLARPATLESLREAWSSFRGVPQELGLHTAPAQPIQVRDELDRPQPRLDRDAGGGMTVTVGRIAKDTVLDWRFLALSHNTVRGAAGAALLNAELLLARGYLKPRR